jgi:DNA-directed RNA polymerase specialized sigma24 family protein
MESRSIGFTELHTQLKITNRLLVAGLKNTMRQNELIALLSTTGASHKEVAEVLNTTSATVQVTLQREKKKRAKQESGDAQES